MLDKGYGFNEQTKKIYFYKDFIFDTQHRVEGNVDINHKDKVIRLYNFPEIDLGDQEKCQIILALLEEVCLLPDSKISKERLRGNIAEYTLLKNGYLLDGSYKEPNKKYKSIIEELIDSSANCRIPKYMSDTLNLVKEFYNANKDVIGKAEASINLRCNFGLSGYRDCYNVVNILASYLTCKRKSCKIYVENKIWNKEKKIIVLPRYRVMAK